MYVNLLPTVSTVSCCQREAGGIRKPPRGRQVVDALKGRSSTAQGGA